MGAGQPISADTLKEAAHSYHSGTSIILRTDYADWNFSLESYYLDSPHLDASAVSWIAEQVPPLLVCDFPAVDRADEWAEGTHEQALFTAGIPIVYSCGNLWLTRRDTNTPACLPLAVKGLDASPARIIAIEGAFHA